MDHNFENHVDWLVKQIGSRKRMLPLFAHVSGSLSKQVDKDLEKFIEKYAFEKVYEDDELMEYAVPSEHSARYKLLTSSFDDSIIFGDLLPKMTLVSLVSVFDSYLARLLKTLFLVKPESLNSSNKQLSLSQLSDFDSMESAREYIVDCEIESLLRDSHIKQFDWLEDKLGIPLKNLPAWKHFVEVTELRNLFVHADGVVSKQYLKVCASVGYPLDDSVTLGEKLSVTPEYYSRACDYIAEVGIKLNQVMWRKLIPKDIGGADDSLVDVTYDLLEREEYSLAETILEFATKPPIRNNSTEISLYLKVNLAISLKGQGKNKECMDLVDSIDWSALADMFKLASFVLKENYDEAASIMNSIGSAGRPTKDEYKLWPLFNWFRKTDLFKETYEKVFSEPYKIIAHTDALSDKSSVDEDGDDAKS